MVVAGHRNSIGKRREIPAYQCSFINRFTVRRVERNASVDSSTRSTANETDAEDQLSYCPPSNDHRVNESGSTKERWP
ncbi:hypothetical protein V2G26_006709 [Clonostachys chloroleuca]